MPSAPKPNGLLELHQLGWNLEISAAVADRIWAQLMIIDGRFWQGAYRSESVALLDAHYYAAYHAIATEIVDAQTPDEVLEDLIPTTICMFQKKVQWQGWESAEFMKKVLHGPIEEWKGKRLLMAADILEIPQSPRIEPPPLLPVSPPGPAGQSSLKHCTRRS